MRIVTGVLLAAAMGLGVGGAHASILLSDNFESEQVPAADTYVADYDSFANFFVSDGTVDLLASPNTFGLPGTGNFVDLDGSSNNGGFLETIDQYAYGAGDTVTLSFLAAGNHREGTDNLFGGFRFFGPRNITNVSFTGFTSVATPDTPSLQLYGVTDLASDAPYATYSIRFTALTAGSFGAVIGTGSHDNIGPLIDNVLLTSVPEPAAWTLMIGGLAAVGGALRRRRRAATA